MSLFNPKKDKLPQGVTLKPTETETVVHLAPSVNADFILEGPDAGDYRFVLEEGARMEVLAFTDGAKTSIEAEMRGKDSYFSFKGLSVLEDSQEQRLKVTALHKAPHTTSRQLYKSVLSEKAFSDLETKV